MGQKVCGWQCGLAYSRRVAEKDEAKRKKEERRKDREKREKLKTRSDYLKDAQREFNRYIRYRDASKPCICCGKPLSSGDIGGSYDAGHYRSVGSAPHLRFDERNCHAQRKQCNRYGAGRAVDYRLGLIARLGVQVVEALESDQTSKNYTEDDLIAIRNKYRKMANDLAKAIAKIN